MLMIFQLKLNFSAIVQKKWEIAMCYRIIYVDTMKNSRIVLCDPTDDVILSIEKEITLIQLQKISTIFISFLCVTGLIQQMVGPGVSGF